MRVFQSVNDEEAERLLRAGAVGILRTDTLYRLVCQAASEQAVQRIYRLKSRSEHKSPIVLVGALTQLFDTPTVKEMTALKEVWPGKVSVILPSVQAPQWLRRGNESIAYRLPAGEALQNLLAKTGPLIAPSANPEGHAPAMTIDEAYDYFGEQVDFYVDGGMVNDDAPSRLVRVRENGEVERLR